MRLRAIATTLTLLLPIAAIVGGSDPSQAAPQPRQAEPTPNEALTPAQRTQAQANDLEADARAHYADIYGGLVLTEESTHVEVYLTKQDESAKSQLSSHLATGRVTFLATQANESQLRDEQATVLAQGNDLLRDGVKVASIGPDPRIGAVRLEVEDLTPDQNSKLVQRFGPLVRPIEVADAQTVPADRANDTAPWFGGDFISDHSGTCTSGIPTHNGLGQQYLLTAAHCFGVNALVYNYAASFAGSSTNLIGPVTSQDLQDGRYDAEVISAPSGAGNKSWVGGTVTTMARNFIGAGPTQIGSIVYLSGAFEGEHAFTVTNVSTCQPPTITGLQAPPYPRQGNGWACGRVHASSGNNQSVGKGDSGGPVYQYFGSNIKAVGIASSIDNPTVTCVNWSAPNQAPGRPCSNNVTFTEIAPLLAQWSLTVN